MSSSNQRPANRGFRSVLGCAISHYRQSSCLSAPEPLHLARGWAVHRRGLGNGSRQPHLHHAARGSCGRKDGSGIDGGGPMLTMLVSRGKRSRPTARPVPAGTPALAGPDQRRPIRQAIPAGAPDRGRWHRWRAPANAVGAARLIIMIGRIHRPRRLAGPSTALPGDRFQRLGTSSLNLPHAHPARQWPPAGSFPNSSPTCLDVSCRRPASPRPWKAFEKRKVRG